MLVNYTNKSVGDFDFPTLFPIDIVVKLFYYKYVMKLNNLHIIQTVIL